MVTSVGERLLFSTAVEPTPILTDSQSFRNFREVQERLGRTFPAAKMDLTDPNLFQAGAQIFYDVYRGGSIEVTPCTFSPEELEQLKGRERIPVFDPDSDQWGSAEAQIMAPHYQTTAGHLERLAHENDALIITPEQYQWSAIIQHAVTGYYLDHNGLTKTRIPIINQRGNRAVILVYFDQEGIYHCEVDSLPGRRDYTHIIGGRLVYKSDAALRTAA